MSSRLRSLDSKISFFAFADIITAVSGVLIFVALLLATDLGRPTSSRTESASAATEQQILETLAQQVELDEENQRLEALLATAETAPDLGKIQADMARLRAQLAQEKEKQAVLTDQMTASQAAMAERDRVLGLTDLKANIQRLLHEVAAIVGQNAAAHTNTDDLEQKVAHAEAQLLKLRQREGQIWLIPEQSTTTKEPILVTVSGAGVAIEQFDHPERRKQLDLFGVDGAFKAYLRTAKPENQYVVFLIRPSGIGTFQDLVKLARDQGFDVGFDALEENRQVHFSTPPPIDETTPPPVTQSNGRPPSGGSGGNGGAGTAANGGGGGNGTRGGSPDGQTPGQGTRPTSGAPTNTATAAHTNSPPTAAAASSPPPAPELTWWQRLIAWIKSKL